jgi:hypothetical protein
MAINGGMAEKRRRKEHEMAIKTYRGEHDIVLTAQAFRARIAECCQAAQRREERVLGIGAYYFLSTRYGDGFVLAANQNTALPLCIDGEAIDYEYEVVEEIDAMRFTVEFTGTY